MKKYFFLVLVFLTCSPLMAQTKVSSTFSGTPQASNFIPTAFAGLIPGVSYLFNDKFEISGLIGLHRSTFQNVQNLSFNSLLSVCPGVETTTSLFSKKGMKALSFFSISPFAGVNIPLSKQNAEQELGRLSKSYCGRITLNYNRTLGPLSFQIGLGQQINTLDLSLNNISSMFILQNSIKFNFGEQCKQELPKSF